MNTIKDYLILLLMVVGLMVFYIIVLYIAHWLGGGIPGGV